jgi:hypothetical protein
VFFAWKCIKIIFFHLKKLFLTSAHQNNLKTLKIILSKNIIFHETPFETQSQTTLKSSLTGQSETRLGLSFTKTR